MTRKNDLPVYGIQRFQKKNENEDFYANDLKTHFTNHDFTFYPHKHDFYLVVLVTKGSGIHEIDFDKHIVKKGNLFLLKPGQMHAWDLSDDIEGFVFFHSREFFDTPMNSLSIKDFNFYRSERNSSLIQLSNESLALTEFLMAQIVKEFSNEQEINILKIHALIQLVYFEAESNYISHSENVPRNYLLKFYQFEELLEKHFLTMKLPRDYSNRLNISEKHLNRIIQSCIHKTSSQFIAERIILEAKRLLIKGKMNVTEIAEHLGYPEVSYFVRFFKKHVGYTPLLFLKEYQKV